MTETAGMLLQKRDLELLKALFACGFLSTSQIQKLFFNQNHSVVCRRLNKRLLPNKIVTRYRSGLAFCSTEAVYTLGTEGISILAEELNVDTSEIFKPGKQKFNPLFLSHTLEINDFWISLRAACEISKDEYQIVSWWTERKLRKRFQRPGKVDLPLPDSRFVLHRRKDQTERLFLLEIDRGTERQAIFQKKIDRYLNYYVSGQHKADFGFDVFRVLIVTPDDQRLKSVLKVSAEAGANNIFLFSLKRQISQETILNPIWITPRDFYDVSRDSSETIIIKEKSHGTPPKSYAIF